MTERSAVTKGYGLRARLAAMADSDLLYEFRRSRLVMIAACIAVAMVATALLAPWIAPYNPYDSSTLNLIDAHNPPSWSKGGDARYLLGTDDQGRDVLSTILYGTRSSILIGVCSVLLALTMGVTLGLMAGYFGGRLDSVIMRIADVQLTFPAILTALMIDGVARMLLGSHQAGGGEFWILVVAIGFSFWVQFARVVRGSTLVEKNKEYVQAARVIGLSAFVILRRHILPNVMPPIDIKYHSWREKLAWHFRV